VLLVDGDLGLANVDIQLGLTPERDLAAVVRRRVPLRDALTAFAPGRFAIAAGRSGSGALSTLDGNALDYLIDELRRAAASYDCVLLDLGAGVERPVRRLAAAADALAVVVTDEPTSLTDAYAVLKLHAADASAAPSAIVVNQAASRQAGERTYATLARAAAHFLGRTPIAAGVIRRDPRVRDAIRRQTLLLTCHPNCAAASDAEEVAGALWSLLAG
jgi:flagellar biosynthesis protein FlhG